MAGNSLARRAGLFVLALLAGSIGAGPAWQVRADELKAAERAAAARQAQALSRNAMRLYEAGKVAAACDGMAKALELYKRLYPADKFPDGHPDLAFCLCNMGFLLQANNELENAEPYLRQSVEMFRRVYPPDTFPDGSPDLATSLDNLGQLLKVRGELVKAEPVCREALAMYRRLYPADKYPDGQADLATCLDNLGDLLVQRGDYGKAEPFCREALAMYRRLYPPDKYPNGQPDLVICLNHLGDLLRERGEFDEAERCCRDVLAMRRKLYPADRFPDGHADVAESLFVLGKLLRNMSEYDKAEPVLRDAIDMYRRLYPADKYPDGNRELASSLNELGMLLAEKGEFGEAEPYYRDALEMDRRLFPADKYPDGHAELATILENQGAFRVDRGEYAKAEPFYRDALAMRRRLYPADKYPDGHPDLANSLNNLGNLLEARGEYAEAGPFYRDALAMRQKLYPANQFPAGHPTLATSLNNMASLLEDRGEYAKAESYHRQAIAMSRRLYPADKFPRGHPKLATDLANLATSLASQGEYAKAEPLCREALDMLRRLYPADQYPDGQPDLARSLENMSFLLQERGERADAALCSGEALKMLRKLYPPDKFPDGHHELASGIGAQGKLLESVGQHDEAERLYREALAMCRRLYPADKYPDGHHDLAMSLNDLGALLAHRAEYDQAEPYVRESLDINRRLYPADKFPDGHFSLAASLANRGALCLERGETGKAAEFFTESAAMYDRLAAAFAASGAEAEALNFAANLPAYRTTLLLAAAHADGADPAECYAVLWRGKAALASILERRNRLVRAAAAADDKTRDKLLEYQAVRQDLSRLALAPADAGDSDRADALRQLTDRKERLEKELAGALPPPDRTARPFADLRDALPDRAAFVDLYDYRYVDVGAGQRDVALYAAFILRKGQPVHRVEIKDGDAVEKDLAEWRQDIDKGFHSDAAARLREALWTPIRKELGENIDTVYVCPDGPLSALPWPALPGREAGHVLLEDHAFAVVPSGPFLLEQLTRPADTDRDARTLLAVGGVRYDRAGAPADKAGKPWHDLPATDKERAGIVAEAAKLPHAPSVVERSGSEATAARLSEDLPKARWAHLATHGFFAAPESQEREHLFRPDEFLLGARGERLGTAARNPLTLSGVVLAGANQPTDADPGILTGEAVAALDLDGMDLAVLSACQTGLGEAAGGEGVFGLQRAFHIAGAKNVVASLWRVDDESARALMNVFYAHLWGKGESPLEALRHAQLELYRNPEAVPNLAKGSRSPDWDATFQAVTRPPADPQARPGRPAAVRDWAAFVLSGAGR